MSVEQLLADLAQTYGYRLRLDAKAVSGAVGAWFVRDETDKCFVLKHHNAEAFPNVLLVPARAERLRLAGYPVPRYETPFELRDTCVLLQNVVGGTASLDLGPGLLQDLILLNDLQLGMGDDRARFPHISAPISPQFDVEQDHNAISGVAP